MNQQLLAFKWPGLTGFPILAPETQHSSLFKLWICQLKYFQHVFMLKNSIILNFQISSIIFKRQSSIHFISVQKFASINLVDQIRLLKFDIGNIKCYFWCFYLFFSSLIYWFKHLKLVHLLVKKRLSVYNLLLFLQFSDVMSNFKSRIWSTEFLNWYKINPKWPLEHYTSYFSPVLNILWVKSGNWIRIITFLSIKCV